MAVEENQNSSIFKTFEKTKRHIKPTTVIITIIVVAIFFATAFFMSLPGSAGKAISRLIYRVVRKFYKFN